MITHGSFLISSVRSLAVIRTSVMAGLSCCCGGSAVGVVRNAPSKLRQHLAKLLGGGSDDGDEIGFAKPALGAVALQIAPRAAMEHRGMRSRDRGIAKPQTQRDDAAPVTVIRIVGIGGERHRLLLELGIELAE